MSSRKYVVIGSGVAGISAVQAVRQSDPTGEIHIVSEDPFGYYSRPGLAYYLTGELDQGSLFPFRKKEIQELRVHWHQTGAKHISPDHHYVRLNNQAALPFDRLLIATGSLAVPLKIQGADLNGVYKLDSLTDAQAILKACKNARSAVVVGGGITALELVEGLRANKLHVHYLLRGTRY
jgi:NAD(P)H-nitrite reductase large subunit